MGPVREAGPVAAMRRDLGQQLAALRRQAGLSQQGLADRVGYSRSAVSLTEIGQKFPAREFWQACDQALNAAGVLAAGTDQIREAQAAGERAAALAAQEAREARALAAFTAARQHTNVRAVVTAPQPCPHCGAGITVLATLIPPGTSVQEAKRPQG
jgi:transcriptional regulator with XRE-family HTH domain